MASRAFNAGNIHLKFPRRVAFIASGLVLYAFAGGAQSATVVVPQGLVRVATSPPSPEATMPQQATLAPLFPIRQTLYEALIGFDPKTGNRNIPMLAESWSHSEDFKVRTFKLRRGVKFHRNAGELTSEDVKFSVELITRPTSLASDAAVFRSLVESIATPDPYTVVFNLTKPVDFAAKLVIWDTSLLITSKKYFEEKGEREYSRNPVGTGPYQLDSFVPGQIMRYSFFPDYWGNKPEFARLELRFVADDQTRMNMLLSREIDVADVPRVLHPAAEAAGFKIDAGVVPAVTPLLWFGSMYSPNANGMPWNDSRVREALNISFDRDAIARSIYRGSAVPVAFGTIGPATPGYAELNRKPYPYDPARAKQLLREAGFGSGLQFVIKVISQAGVPELATTIEAISAQWSNIGVSARLEPSEQGPIVQGYRSRSQMNFLFSTRSPYNSFDPSSLFDVFYARKGGFGGVNDEISTAVDVANAETDPEKKKNLNARVGQLVHDGFWTIPLPAVIPSVARNPEVVSSWTGTFAYQLDGLATLGRRK